VGHPVRGAVLPSVGHRVNRLRQQGFRRYAEAQEASANAKKWAIWGAVAGVIVGIIYGIIAVAGGMSNYM
jgi:hypothetical protein